MVNFLGAVVFSIFGMLYIQNRDNYRFVEKFIPTSKIQDEKIDSN